MRTMMNFLKMVALVLALIITACSPEDGEDGAIGPQGPQGVAGQDGMNGEDGNANIIVSDWTTFVNADWGSGGGSTQSINLTAPEIDSNTLENSAVLIYMRLDFEPTVIYIVPWDDGLFEFVVNGISEGNIRITARRRDGSALPDPTNWVDISFKYVAVPANTTSKTSSVDFTKMSYYEVMDYFGLDY
ncbi:hypothetical protein [Allomuricauda sp. d1]|uniref:collagen-like triple helix repeat-containing protein n=1 Tax=Allomuricauda sp. d1 TaxID=3136725 RepID=UPI0031DE40A5